MQVYDKLSIPIRSQTNQEIPIAVQQTLLYQWKAAHKFLLTALELSHTFSRQFVVLSRDYCAAYPEKVTDRICSHCCVLLVPGVTSTARVRARSKRSKANRCTKSAGEKIKNALVIRCSQCNTVQEKAAGWRRFAPATEATPVVTASNGGGTARGLPLSMMTAAPRARAAESSLFIPLSSTSTSGPQISNMTASSGFARGKHAPDQPAAGASSKPGASGAGGFSFRNIAYGGGAAVGTKRSADGAAGSNVNFGGMTSLALMASTTTNSTTTTSAVATPSASAAALTGNSSSSTSGVGGGVNLLDLERQMKKNKKKKTERK